MDKDRITVEMLGRELGSASGWDGEPFETIWFYNFEPKSGINLPAGTLTFDFVNGIVSVDNESTLVQLDSIEFLYSIPRIAR